MRLIVSCIAAFAIVGVIGCADRTETTISSATNGPGYTDVGVDWGGTGTAATFKLMVGFAASPGWIVEIRVENATTAAQAASQIEEKWNSTPGIGDYPVELCGDHMVIFPGNHVGSFAVFDSDSSWDPIISTSTPIALEKGLTVKKVIGVCSE